ncbi:MAG TPA: FHA domain-containing protein, partial [Kofleriaceae bacterium]|nr:FHA domain-containing protein [Kofleriaceae bacterium]
MVNATADDPSDAQPADQPAAPVAILVARGLAAVHAVLPAAAPLVLGRRLEVGGAVVPIDDERMSRTHAAVSWEAGAWRVRDLGSHNGSFVGGARVDGEVVVRGDAVVRLGQSIFLLVADGRGHDRPVADDDEAVIGPELGRALDGVRARAGSAGLLLHGESGTGKELAARIWHRARPCAAGPFVAVNCATVPEGVAERILFGARKGAFSGATDATGLVQAADGGTLFLDEVADLEPAVQAKLLRV